MISTRGLTAVDNVELCSVDDRSGVTAKLVWAVLTEMLFAHAKHHGSTHATAASLAEPHR
jgi:agmatinase